MTPDPIGLAGGINLWPYVGNNPLNWLDPLGLEDFPTKGALPGTNIPYRMDMRQQPEPNMHVYWEGKTNGPETIVSPRGGWVASHGNKNVVAPPKSYRSALRQVTKSFMNRCGRIARVGGRVLGVAGNILLIVDDLDRLERASEGGRSYGEQLQTDLLEAGNPAFIITPFGPVPNPYKSNLQEVL